MFDPRCRGRMTELVSPKTMCGESGTAGLSLAKDAAEQLRLGRSRSLSTAGDDPDPILVKTLEAARGGKLRTNSQRSGTPKTVNSATAGRMPAGWPVMTSRAR